MAGNNFTFLKLDDCNTQHYPQASPDVDALPKGVPFVTTMRSFQFMVINAMETDAAGRSDLQTRSSGLPSLWTRQCDCTFLCIVYDTMLHRFLRTSHDVQTSMNSEWFAFFTEPTFWIGVHHHPSMVCCPATCYGRKHQKQAHMFGHMFCIFTLCSAHGVSIDWKPTMFKMHRFIAAIGILMPWFRVWNMAISKMTVFSRVIL